MLIKILLANCERIDGNVNTSTTVIALVGETS